MEQRLSCLIYLDPYIFHITLYDLASLGVLFIGLTLALLLAFNKRSVQTANVFLSLALAVIVLKTGRLTPFLLPALGPLLYFYVRQLTRPELRFRRKDILHFCPLLVAFWMPTWLVLISVVIYLYLSHRLIQDFYHRLRPVLMDRPRYSFRWLDKALVVLGLFCLLWLFNDIFSFAVALILIGMAAKAILKPDTDAQLIMPMTDRSDAREKGRRLKEAVAANRFYEDAELTLTALAIKLSIHPHDLSRIVNVGLEKNFSDFINEFRVRDIVRKMQDPAYDRLTLLGIAYESGFNSKRTFNRVFKEMTGKTPGEYNNSLKKEGPIDKLAPQSRIQPVILHHEAAPKWSHEKLNRNYMFKNYLKIAWRNMLHNKGYSALNIVGLAAGMAVALLIGLWVTYQYSYDHFLPNYKRLYRVEMNLTSQHYGTSTQTSIALPLTDVLRREIPGVQYVAESDDIGHMNHDLLVGDKKLYLSGGAVGADFFKIFQYPFVKGNASSALKDIYSIVLTESTARTLFGDADPMGKIVRFDNSQGMKVTGVIKDIPKNATLQFNYLTPFAYVEATQGWIKEGRTKWTYNSFSAYVALEPGVNYAQIASKIKDIVNKRSPEMRSLKPEVFMHPLKDWHLYNDFKNGKVAGGFVDYVRLFSIIGILVLAIACINFMNSLRRALKNVQERLAFAKRSARHASTWFTSFCSNLF